MEQIEQEQIKQIQHIVYNLIDLSNEEILNIFIKYNLHFSQYFCTLLKSQLVGGRHLKYEQAVVNLIQITKPFPNNFIYRLFHYIQNDCISQEIYDEYIKDCISITYTNYRVLLSDLIKYMDYMTEKEIVEFVITNSSFLKKDFLKSNFLYLNKDLYDKIVFLLKIR